MRSITVSEWIQVGHRLTKLPGKCQQLHGHSMHIHLTLFGKVDDDGVFESVDQGDVKDIFRQHLKLYYDHHFLMNENDPYVKFNLEGVVPRPADPTTENICQWLGEWAETEFGLRIKVAIEETCTNAAAWASEGIYV